MARTKIRKKKKIQTGKSFLKEIKRFIAIVCVLVVCSTGLLFLYLHYMPEEKAQKVVDNIVARLPEFTEPEVHVKLEPENLPAGAEIPRLQNGQKEQLIRHEGFTVSYNADFKIPNWVAYELTEERVKNARVKRHNKFIPDRSYIINTNEHI